MRIIILTQEDPFYLAKNISYLIRKLPCHSEIVATVLFEASPFGKKESFLKKSLDTYVIFGLNFFAHYSYLYVSKKLDRSTSLEQILKNKGIPIIKFKKNINHSESIQLLEQFSPDLLISIAGNQIFKQPLIDLASKGCLNLHTALLPKYRGLMPSFWVLKNCEKETGVSVFFVDKGIDSGPILVQERIPIHENMTQEELIRKSKKIGMDAIIKAIDLIHYGNYELIPNKDEEKTYYTFPTRKDVKEFRKAGKKFF